MQIAEVLRLYKEDFARVDKEEVYKWKAIGWYKAHWNIDAIDFAKMFETAFAKAKNLLAASMYYPYKMACAYAEDRPEEFRALFRELYDESVPLAKRYSDFRGSFRQYLDEKTTDDSERTKPLNHYQDLHAVSVYLTFEYPEKYYFYKARVYHAFKKLIGFGENRSTRSEVWKIENCNHMCDQVLEVVRQDPEVIEMSRKRLTDDCYSDPESHMIAADVVYFGSWLISQPIGKARSKSETETYWPAPGEYQTGLSKTDWLELLKDPGITTQEHLGIFKMMAGLGGEGTCTRLADIYGGNSNYYNRVMTAFCEHVKRVRQLPDCIDSNGENRYWPIAFVGRYVVEDGKKHFSWKLRAEVSDALGELDLSGIQLIREEDSVTDIAKNTILYGPPGTGKTYSTVIYAVAIVEKRLLEEVQGEPYEDVLDRFHAYQNEGLIESATFHQSYGYEEFIEGIRPVLVQNDDDENEMQYELSPGVFKNLCDRAIRPSVKNGADTGLNSDPVVWKVSLGGTYENPIREECLANGHIRIGWDRYGEQVNADTDFSQHGGKTVLNAFIYKMRIGDIVLSCYSNTTVDAVGIVRGEYEWHDEYRQFKRLRSVDWLVKDIREDITEMNSGTTMTLSSVYRLSISATDAMSIVEKYRANSGEIEPNEKNYVFIIDEINRGNISKIFGELITLVEPSKRIGQPEGMTVLLPYSKKPFGVPDNVYLIGTMNTADRSIATIDTALRRRFQFKEMQPDAETLGDVSVEDVSIGDMLIRMNRRITVLYDRDHTIGHAYFMPLKKNPTIEVLAKIFASHIIPLLQEYFYEDYEKIRLVLGDNNKQNPEEQFVLASVNDYVELFGDTDLDIGDAITYEINEEAFENIEAYRYI